MVPEDPIRAEDVRRAAEQAREHPQRPALSALAFELLSRQAEGRTLFAGKEHVDALAESHGVDRDNAVVGDENLLGILERGPARKSERALVAAFAVAGLGHALAEAPDDQRAGIRDRFVRHADWLEVSTPHVVYAFVDLLLGDPEKRAVWEGVAERVLADARAPAAPRHDARARNAARLSALAASESAAAREALTRVAREAEDLVVRRLASELGGEAGEGSASALVSGFPAPPSRSTGRAIVRLVSGWAALTWLTRLVGRLVGVRREAEIALIPGGLVVRSRLWVLGKKTREREERFTMAALAGVAREVRYPMLHLIVGMIALSAGVLLGGLLAFDAIVTGETVLLLLAAVLVFVGGGLDLALDVLVPAQSGRVSVDLSLLPGRRLRVTRVPAASADAFLKAVERRASS